MAKNIIICCDGTSNEYSHNNTNVVKLYERILLNEKQLNFYDPGVGTSSRSLFVPFRWLSNMLSQGLGLDLNKNVEEAYQYLMDHFEEGDKIFLFGFSRGAHTVRRLACVLEKLGILYKGSDNMIPYVIRMYNKDEDLEIIKKFRYTYTKKCPVHFMGVWDTVSALTKLIPRSKLDGKSSKEITHIYHAVAIDEKRLQFPPNLFDQNDIGANQTLEEVWFAGVHSDVGGYYKDARLSDISLKWMIEKAKNVGLEVGPDYFSDIQANPKGKIHNSWKCLFWFTPWHIYVVLVMAGLLLVDVSLSQLDLYWNIPWRPFSFTTDLLKENWIGSLAIAFCAIYFTKKIRNIPSGAKIHKSVQEKINNDNYNPKNLTRLIKENKIKWVE